MGITPKQLAQIQERLGTPRRKPVPLPAFSGLSRPASTAANQVVLGIDPSLRATGYGIIRLAKPRPETVAFGTIVSPSNWERSRCLAKISQALRQLLKVHCPSVCVIEALFYAQNLQTALVMGEARGASLAAVAEAGLEIYEMAPRRVKQAVVGYGAAQKIAVAKMVQRMLALSEVPEPDAADALALALAYAQELNRFSFGGRKRI